MKFLEKQIYMVEHLLSYRTRVDSKDLNDMLQYSQHSLGIFGLTLSGDIILNISELITAEERQIYGVEILFPVDKAFKSQGQYIYKPMFKLVNAVSTRFYSSYTRLPEVKEKFYSFMKEHSMQPITDIYYVIRQNINDPSSEKVFDAYIAVNSNIV